MHSSNASNSIKSRAVAELQRHASLAPSCDYFDSVGGDAGSHLDGKNTPGSYSALIVLETEEPFCGSYYLLPQYHAALFLTSPAHALWSKQGQYVSQLGMMRMYEMNGNTLFWTGVLPPADLQEQIVHNTHCKCAGCIVFHRSGDDLVGMHGNSGLWRSSDSCHRIALVLYQTDLKIGSE